MNTVQTDAIPEDAERVLAREICDSVHTVEDGGMDPDQPPVLLPTGATARRLFVVGPIVDVTDREEEDVVRASVVNPTGQLLLQAGRFESAIAGQLRAIDIPSTVRIVATPRIVRIDETSKYVLLGLDELTVVEHRRQNRWLDETIRRTVRRIEAFESGAGEETALARLRYDPDLGRYRDAVDIVRDVLLERQTGLSADDFEW